MNDPRYDPEYEYEDDYDYYRQPEVTNVGLPASQLALIIGVNAVVALVISISVVLLAGSPGTPLSAPAAEVPLTEGEPAEQASALPVEGVEGAEGEQVAPAVNSEAQEAAIAAESTPIQSVRYTVEAGDTLTLIAQKFSVPLYDLMVANGLTDENFVQAGQELVIPVGGLPDVTPTFTPVAFPTETPLPQDPPTRVPTNVAIPQEPAATVGPSPTPTETPTAAPSPTVLPTSTPAATDEVSVVIDQVVGAGQFPGETLVILNEGASTSLRNWKIEGSPVAVFSFPDIFLFSGGSIRIHTAAGTNTASDLYLNQSESVWPPGTTIILSDDKNNEVFRYTVPEPQATSSTE